MAVQSVSLDEINKARGTATQNASQQPVKKVSKKSKENYVDRITDKQIREFFAPYGYFDHARNEKAGTIEVLCNDCMIIFNDFTVLADATNWYEVEDDRAFNFHDFFMLCSQLNTTPSRAIADRLESEIFNKMPYYVERKKQFTENNIENVSNNDTYGNLLKATAEKEKHRENLASLNKNFGSSDPEKIADTLARLTPNR